MNCVLVEARSLGRTQGHREVVSLHFHFLLKNDLVTFYIWHVALVSAAMHLSIAANFGMLLHLCWKRINNKKSIFQVLYDIKQPYHTFKYCPTSTLGQPKVRFFNVLRRGFSSFQRFGSFWSAPFEEPAGTALKWLFIQYLSAPSNTKDACVTCLFSVFINVLLFAFATAGKNRYGV